ncbi:hypothetical protein CAUPRSCDRAFT_11772 [Caulochytrium protostelioides]|uniref:Uncharacterized protein n=1 Tax=Caulochytrium protostelioides TaxID=1555241 RepID=A0A4P9WVJ5_9FUNG|nr:hypothetical protein CAUPRSCDRAFT_11772 [Caulochytrium protostelioides]
MTARVPRARSGAAFAGGRRAFRGSRPPPQGRPAVAPLRPGSVTRGTAGDGLAMVWRGIAPPGREHEGPRSCVPDPWSSRCPLGRVATKRHRGSIIRRPMERPPMEDPRGEDGPAVDPSEGVVWAYGARRPGMGPMDRPGRVVLTAVCPSHDPRHPRGGPETHPDARDEHDDRDGRDIGAADAVPSGS